MAGRAGTGLIPLPAARRRPLDAIHRRELRAGARVPAERTLAAAVGVSRGTVVACFEHPVAAGVLRRRQGSGTYLAGRPSRAPRRPAASPSCYCAAWPPTARPSTCPSPPSDLLHLPPTDPSAARAG